MNSANSHAELATQITKYFDGITDEELLRDLEKTDFAFYSDIGESINAGAAEVVCASHTIVVHELVAREVIPAVSNDLIQEYYLTAVTDLLCSEGNSEEMPLAA